MTISTTDGDSVADIAARLAQEITASCIPAGVAAVANGGKVIISGSGIEILQTSITDPGLRHNAIPALSLLGLLLMGAALLIGGSVLARRSSLLR